MSDYLASHKPDLLDKLQSDLLGFGSSVSSLQVILKDFVGDSANLAGVFQKLTSKISKNISMEPMLAIRIAT